MDVVASRTFCLDGRAIVGSIHRPVQMAEHEWRCHVDAGGKRSYATGIDEIQAIQLGLEALRNIVETEFRGAVWTVTGQATTGIPRTICNPFGLEFDAELEAELEAAVERIGDRLRRARGRAVSAG